MMKCRVCGGAYRPVQADGAAYFHGCPSLSIAELIALRPGVAPAVLAQLATTRTFARPGARNENLERRPDGTVDLIADGPGADVIPDAPTLTLDQAIAAVVAGPVTVVLG